MQPFPIRKALVPLVIASLVLSVSMLLLNTNVITNVSAVVVDEVGVYWDSDCTAEVTFIDWGTLTPGSQNNRTVLIRNEGNNPASFSMNTSNWNPPNAPEYMTLTWNYHGKVIDSQKAIQVTLTLSISHSISEITNFNFDIIMGRCVNKVPDVNGDGTVNVLDIILVMIAFGSQPGDPNWDERVDLNNDCLVNLLDLIIVKIAFGANFT